MQQDDQWLQLQDHQEQAHNEDSTQAQVNNYFLTIKNHDPSSASHMLRWHSNILKLVILKSNETFQQPAAAVAVANTSVPVLQNIGFRIFQ